MGQAKQRGSKEQRIAQALERRQLDDCVHVFINETKSDAVLISQWPCAECGNAVTPDSTQNKVLGTPVQHGLQFGKCSKCGAAHFIASARTKEDCVQLEPVVAELRRTLGVARPS